MDKIKQQRYDDYILQTMAYEYSISHLVIPEKIKMLMNYKQCKCKFNTINGEVYQEGTCEYPYSISHLEESQSYYQTKSSNIMSIVCQMFIDDYLEERMLHFSNSGARIAMGNIKISLMEYNHMNYTVKVFKIPRYYTKLVQNPNIYDIDLCQLTYSIYILNYSATIEPVSRNSDCTLITFEYIMYTPLYPFSLYIKYNDLMLGATIIYIPSIENYDIVEVSSDRMIIDTRANYEPLLLSFQVTLDVSIQKFNSPISSNYLPVNNVIVNGSPDFLITLFVLTPGVLSSNIIRVYTVKKLSQADRDERRIYSQSLLSLSRKRIKRNIKSDDLKKLSSRQNSNKPDKSQVEILSVINNIVHYQVFHEYIDERSESLPCLLLNSLTNIAYECILNELGYCNCQNGYVYIGQHGAVDLVPYHDSILLTDIKLTVDNKPPIEHIELELTIGQSKIAYKINVISNISSFDLTDCQICYYINGETCLESDQSKCSTGEIADLPSSTLISFYIRDKHSRVIKSHFLTTASAPIRMTLEYENDQLKYLVEYVSILDRPTKTKFYHINTESNQMVRLTCVGEDLKEVECLGNELGRFYNLPRTNNNFDLVILDSFDEEIFKASYYISFNDKSIQPPSENTTKNGDINDSITTDDHEYAKQNSDLERLYQDIAIGLGTMVGVLAIVIIGLSCHYFLVIRKANKYDVDQ